MVLDAVSNFVRGTTDAAVDSTQTTVSVSDASIFPDPATEGEYNVVIWDAANFPRPDQDGDVEILRVTAIDTGANDLTVTRAQETTPAAAHPDGSAIHLSPTAKMFSDIESEYTASGENFDGEGTSEFSNLQSVSTDSLLNAGETEELIDSLANPQSNFQFNVDMDKYDRVKLRIVVDSQALNSDITLSSGSGSVGSYEFTERSGANFTSVTGADQFDLIRTSQEGFGEFLLSFSARDILLVRGDWMDAFQEFAHAVSGQIDGSNTTGVETFTINVARGENRLKNVDVVGFY